MEARRRLLPAIIGLVGFTLLGSLADAQFWNEWWFYVGLGTALSATFIEPFFTRPQEALINAAGGAGAFAAAARTGVEGLWLAYLATCALAGTTAILSILIRDRPARLKTISYRISQRIGRAWMIGGAALALEVIRRAASGVHGYQYLLGGTAVLIFAVIGRWHDIMLVVRGEPPVSATATAGIGPRLLLAASSGSSLETGTPVKVQTSVGSCTGYIASRLSHKDGLRYQIALTREWTSVCQTFPTEITLAAIEGDDAPRAAGVVLPGTTDLSIELHPFSTPHVGDPLLLSDGNDNILYQVNDVKLVAETLSGAAAVVPHATARQVGIIQDGHVRAHAVLPIPHQLLTHPHALSATLPDGFVQVGVIKGTNVPVGISNDPAGRAHLAVLGMSGMGKTAAAQRISKALSDNSVVVALDTTGEYRSRLNFPAWNKDFTALGHFVYEPGGEPSQTAATFIKDCMDAGNREYQAGGQIVPRVVVLEEAHSFIPEWNFSTRMQQDNVALSTRYIMQSRKFGITFVIVSQRTAVVSKSALSQCGNYVVLRTIDQTSLDYMEAVVGPEHRHAIPALSRYEALCVGPVFNLETPTIVTLSPPV